MQPVTDHYLAGFVVAEGCFTSTRPPRERYAFRVSLSATDRVSCQAFRDWFGVGTVHEYPRRRPHYDDEVVYQVSSARALVEVVVPFMDRCLPPSHKRIQYEQWRDRLLDFWEHRAKRPRPCCVAGCEAVRRSRGLCRHHLYERFGR